MIGRGRDDDSIESVHERERGTPVGVCAMLQGNAIDMANDLTGCLIGLPVRGGSGR